MGKINVSTQEVNEDELYFFGFNKSEIAVRKLKIIASKLNEQVSDKETENFYPMFRWTDDSHTDIVFQDSAYNPDKSYASIWSQFYVKTPELAEHLGKDYLDLWKDIIIQEDLIWGLLT